MSASGDSSVISNKAIIIYQWVVFAVLCQIINIFGVATNIINIICFVKHGFKDTVNISLLGLAISDLGSLTTMIWTCLCITPAVSAADLPFDPMDVMYLTSAMPHFCFTRVSGCITAMIILERCLCIVAPLKIKSIITPKRSTVMNVCVFVTFYCSSAPVYAVNRLGKTFSTLKNKTVIGLISTKNRFNVEMISFTINNFFIPFISFFIIIVCTAILSFQLRNQTKWRQTTFNTSHTDRVSSRNLNTAKMVVMISILFIACFIPVSIDMLVFALVPEMSTAGGKYYNIAVMIGGIGYFLESVNSSVNIFIYYHMSSKYRENFMMIFHRNKIVKNVIPQSKNKK